MDLELWNPVLESWVRERYGNCILEFLWRQKEFEIFKTRFWRYLREFSRWRIQSSKIGPLKRFTESEGRDH
jgi:hypothetical protein